MIPILAFLVLLLAWASTAASGRVKYSLSKTYDFSNFVNEFEFVQRGVDPHGNVQSSKPNLYVGYDDNWVSLKRYSAKKNESVQIGFSNNIGDLQNLRLESKDTYTEGLFIFRFLEVPDRYCGLISSLSTVSKDGLDSITFMSHGYEPKRYIYGKIKPPARHEKCSATAIILDQDKRTSVNPNGQVAIMEDKAFKDNVYALQRTNDSITVWSWSAKGGKFKTKMKGVLQNVLSDHPDPTTWGLARFRLGGKNCKMNKHLSPHRLAFQIDSCNTQMWNWWSKMQADVSTGLNCHDSTDQSTCYEYMKSTNNQFERAKWELDDIRVFKAEDVPDEPDKADKTLIYSSKKDETLIDPSLIIENPVDSASNVKMQVETFSEDDFLLDNLLIPAKKAESFKKDETLIDTLSKNDTRIDTASKNDDTRIKTALKQKPLTDEVELEEC